MRKAPLLYLLPFSFAACVGDSNVTPTDGGSDAIAQDSPITTDSPAGDVGVDAGWTPAVLDAQGSLALWLEASAANITIDTGGVGLWSDLSKNKNNASSATSLSRPKTGSSILNGHDIVEFPQAGASLTIPDAPSLQFGTDEFAIFSVVKYASGGPDLAFLFAKSTCTVKIETCDYSGGPELLISSAADASANMGPAFHADTSYEMFWNGNAFDTKFHIIGLRRTSNVSFTLYVDSLAPQPTSLAWDDLTMTGTDVQLGAISRGTFQPTTDFEMAELIAVHSSSAIVGDGIITSIQQYYKSKYGL